MEPEYKKPQVQTNASIGEICRLIALLVWSVLRKGLRLLLKYLVVFIIFIVKLCVKFYGLCVDAWHAWIVFWHDDNTQEKVRKLKRGLKYAYFKSIRGIKKFCKWTWKWTIIGLKKTGYGLKIAAAATVSGIVIGFKATIQGIIHLRTTLRNMMRAIKLGHIRRARRYQEFKRRGGMQAALTSMGNNLKHSVNTFMEEEQNEASEEATTEEEIITEELFVDSHAKKMSDKIIKYLEKLIDES